jgi:hypothetical protein
MGKFLWLALVVLFAGTLRAEELKLSAVQLYELAASKHLRLSSDSSSIELERGVLIEDDGPAAGFSYKPNEERLARGVQIKKTLVVDDPRASTATLLLGGKGDFELALNGQPCPWEPVGKSGNYWFHYRLPVDRLRPGANDFVVSGKGNLWIARYDEFSRDATATLPVDRSARSADGGQTWQVNRLGSLGDISGEYCVRLHLDQFQPRGQLTLPVIDSANLQGRAIAPALDTPPAIAVEIDGTASEDGPFELQLRSGPTPDFSDSPWSEWAEIQQRKERPLAGRYFQLLCRMGTESPLKSPQLRGLTITTEDEQAPSWASELKVIRVRNETIAPHSIPFVYETRDRGYLKKLREQYRLDDVVAGAKDELELIARLARWTSEQWKHPGHIGKVYPRWNALEILTPHDDGTPIGGFCQQYAVVFLQACESFGLIGRCVSLSPGNETSLGRSGHETTEIWSNQFGKWIYVDGNLAWYAADQESGTPLSLLELRDRQLRTLRQEAVEPTRIVRLADTKPAWTGLDVWPPFIEMRLIPRSNFLESNYPLPLNQGMRGWFWPYHYVWTGSEAPHSLLYHHYVRKPSDWNWKLNQVRLWLQATSMPGQLRVHTSHSMPSFEKLVAKFDDRQAIPVTNSFQWSLQPGTNRLEVWPRNKLGRLGIASSIVVEYSDSPTSTRAPPE